MSFNSVRPVSGISQPGDYNNPMNRVPDSFPVNSNSFFDSYDFDKQYLFGHQYLPNQSQSARVLAGSILDPFDILGGKKVPEEMKEYNDSTVLRAKTLTYFDKELGMKIPLRLEAMGGPGAKKLVPVAPDLLEIPELPEVMIFVPQGFDMAPNMRNWTPEQSYFYAVGNGRYDQETPSGYVNYLSQGGEPIQGIQYIIDQHRRKTPNRTTGGRFQTKPPKPPRESTPQKPPKAIPRGEGEGLGFEPISTGVGQRPVDVEPVRRGPEDREEKDERAFNARENERMEAEDMKIRKRTNRQHFDSINKGIAKGLDNKASTIKKDLWEKRGGKEWVNNYIKRNGEPQNTADLDRMKQAWDTVYTRPDPSVEFKNYPSVQGSSPSRPASSSEDYIDYIDNYDSSNETELSKAKLKKAIKKYLSEKERPSNKTPENGLRFKRVDDKIDKILRDRDNRGYAETTGRTEPKSQALKDAEKRVRDAKRIIDADSGRGLDYIVKEISRERLLPGGSPSDPGQRPDLDRAKRPGLGRPKQPGRDEKNPTHPEYFATRIPYNVLMGGNEAVRDWMIENGIPEAIADSNDSQIIYDYMRNRDQGPGKPFRVLPSDPVPGAEDAEDSSDDADENTPLINDDPFDVIDIEPDDPSLIDKIKDKIPPVIPIIPGGPLDFDPKKKPKRKPDVPDVPRNPDDPFPDPDDPDDPDDPVPVPSILPSRQPMLQSGHLRPLLNVGGQAVLGLTKKEQLEEVNNYALFDLPVVPGQDLENPLFLSNIERQNFRFYAQNPPISYYAEQPRRMMPVGPRQRFEPNFREACGHPYATQFRDPFDRQRFNKVDDAYRSKGPTKQAIMEQMGNIYPDIAENYPAPRQKMTISAAVIMLSRKY